MADVYLALVEGPPGSRFSKTAVVKRLRAAYADDPEFVAMLVDEARITARLSHANVVQLLEVGTEGDNYFLAMEYLDGQPLHRLDRRTANAGEPLSCDAQVLVIIGVLAGLQYAHTLTDYDGSPLGIVHRDVTPQNVFVSYDGQVKVLDFGIAKACGRMQETQHGIVKGKVRYMAPEQARGAESDHRADLFAAGVMVWQAAVGRRFWSESDEFSILQALLDGAYDPSPRAVRADVPEELDAICRRAMAVSPEDRYASAFDMLVDLESFLGLRALAARRELTEKLGRHFEKERRELRGMVEESGKTSAAHSVPVRRRPAPPAESLSPLSLPAATAGQGASFAPGALILTLPPDPASAPPPPPTPTNPWLVTVAMAAASAVLVLGSFIARPPGEAPRETMRRAAASPAHVVDDFVGLSPSPLRPRASRPVVVRQGEATEEIVAPDHRSRRLRPDSSDPWTGKQLR